jgi:hypothetical protein
MLVVCKVVHSNTPAKVTLPRLANQLRDDDAICISLVVNTSNILDMIKGMWSNLSVATMHILMPES